MSFVESVFSAGFIQKTIKGDQNVKLNRAYPSRKQFQKVLEDPRRQSAEAEHVPLTCGATSVLHHLKDCIYVVLLSWFDPRV